MSSGKTSPRLTINSSSFLQSGDPDAAFSIAAQILCGVAGMVSCVTPAGLRASNTAFMTAIGAPIAPASPQPLAPSGLLGVVLSIDSIFIIGRSCARGMQ